MTSPSHVAVFQDNITIKSYVLCSGKLNESESDDEFEPSNNGFPTLSTSPSDTRSTRDRSNSTAVSAYSPNSSFHSGSFHYALVLENSSKQYSMPWNTDQTSTFLLGEKIRERMSLECAYTWEEDEDGTPHEDLLFPTLGSSPIFKGVEKSLSSEQQSNHSSSTANSSPSMAFTVTKASEDSYTSRTAAYSSLPAALSSATIHSSMKGFESLQPKSSPSSRDARLSMSTNSMQFIRMPSESLKVNSEQVFPSSGTSFSSTVVQPFMSQKR